MIALSVIVVLFTYDCMLNGMINPVYTLAAGGVTGVACRTAAIRRTCARLEHVQAKAPA